MKFYLVTYPNEANPESIGYQFFESKKVAECEYKLRVKEYEKNEYNEQAYPEPKMKVIEIPKPMTHRQQVFFALRYQVV